MPREPRIHEEFPIEEGEQLSPPIVSSPIHECAETVHVYGFIPHATVKVYANLNELVGEAVPPFAFGQINLMRPLKLGESITATQTVGNITSNHSIQPVIVSAYQPVGGQFTKPEVGKDLYECGVVVPVDKLVPSVRVHVAEDGSEIGSKPTDETWEDVLTQPLHAGGDVTAQQIACEDDPAKAIESPWSDPVKVKPAPNPPPTPVVDENSLIVGNDIVGLTNLLVGASVTILDNGILVSTGWFANGPANFFPIDSPLQPGSVIKPTQELCGNVSPESGGADPHAELKAPVVVGPICEGAQFVVIRDTVINANVVVFCNNSIVGYGGAVAGDLVLGLGGNVQLAAGDVITAIQYMGPTISPMSNAVTVVPHLEIPFVEIQGGEPFFLAEAGEQQIGGPVFPRGRGGGPVIKAQACCSQDVKVEILGPDGNLVAKPQTVELFPGYFTANWDWQSLQGWEVPTGIPIGEYTVVVTTGCEQEEARVRFYVIFAPDDVGGPPRFSFNETAVWFGTGKNATRALLYHLHPDDARVFSIAIKAANGAVDPLKAAVSIADAEEKLFAWSLDYHTNDVIDLLQNHTSAQCADDACCLTALLRAVGIPAHPVTADAALETGDANWTFDTWIEFLAPVPGGTEWLILHPHQYPNDPPMSRKDFGTTKGVATKGFNDLIVMANGNWVWSEAGDGLSDVTYYRNDCGEPEQTLNKKAWIGELCEQGYWVQPHWDCSGVSGQPLSAPEGFRFDGEEPRFGGTLSGSITVANRGEERTFGRLVIELVSDLPESKRFPEETFDALSSRAALDPGRELTLPFELRIPPTLAPGRNLYVRARIDEHTIELHLLKVRSAIESDLRSPRELRLGEEFEITAIVNSVSNRPSTSVDLALSLPYAIRTREPIKQRIERLPARSERAFTWIAQAMAPMEAGTIKLAVSGIEGGSSLSIINVTIADPRAVSAADQPGTRMRYE